MFVHACRITAIASVVVCLSNPGRALAGDGAQGQVKTSGGSQADSKPSALPEPWSHRDIGAVTKKGDAGYADSTYTLAGTLDIWTKADGFQFVYRPLEGDGQIVARVLSVENTAGHAKGGVMIRESLDAGARHATLVVTAADGTQFLVRKMTNDVTTAAKTGRDRGKFPYWVKLVRAGDAVTGYESADGKDWTKVGTATVPMGRQVHVGLVASSHQKMVTSTSKLDNVSVDDPKP